MARVKYELHKRTSWDDRVSHERLETYTDLRDAEEARRLLNGTTVRAVEVASGKTLWEH